MKTNDVVLIGGNHHNGLGLVRSFGINGIKPFGIIISNEKSTVFISKSKYWKNIWIVENEDAALDLLINDSLISGRQIVLIPYSDGAAQMIDLSLDLLKHKYICPSINGEKGKIVELMNKQNQMWLAKKMGLEMLESKIVGLGQDGVFENIDFPVILKPVCSVEGNKLDIAICNNSEELYRKIENFQNLKYDRILVQHYLEEREEFVLTGCICDNQISYSIVKHIRQWPEHRGSGSYSELICDKAINMYAERVLNSISNLGFSGLCDIEFFSDKRGSLYLNEINWRSSGRNFISLYNRVFSSVAYYKWVLGMGYQGKVVNDMRGFSINEVTDFRYVINKGYNFFKWLKDLRKAKSYAIWYVKDCLPSIIKYADCLKKLFLRRT